MLNHWIRTALHLSREPADFYSGARKIIRGRVICFGDPPDKRPVIADCGFTKSKLTALRRGYYHEESIAAAQMLWERRLAQRKYGSVGITTYNHFIKTDPNKKSKRASVMGPCIQSVTLTLLNDRTTTVDVFYRTTEYYKKFPADLVFLRDMLLPNFDFTGAPISSVRFYFANITCHPMYFVTIIPHLKDPLRELDRIKGDDPYFYAWVVKWTARYVCEEHSRGILKFAQALRVRKDAMSRIDPATLRQLQSYLRRNHPGYRNTYVEEPDDEDI